MSTLTISEGYTPAIPSTPDLPTPHCGNLSELAPGASGVISAIGAESELRLRMHALGLMPGRKVRIIRKAPFQGPIQVRSGHTCLLIRREEARNITLEQVL